MLLLTPATIIHLLPKIPDTESGGALPAASRNNCVSWPPGREPFAGFIKPRLGGHKQFYLDLLVRLRAAEHCCIMLLAAKQNAPRYSANRSASATVCGQP